MEYSKDKSCNIEGAISLQKTTSSNKLNLVIILNETSIKYK